MTRRSFVAALTAGMAAVISGRSLDVKPLTSSGSNANPAGLGFVGGKNIVRANLPHDTLEGRWVQWQWRQS